MDAVRGNYYSSFDPRSLPQCVLWLDADDSNAFSFSTGSNITFWRDKSPIQNDVCASGVPVRQQNIWNGKPGVFFNGTSFFGRTITANTSNELTGFVVADISINAVASARIVSLGTAGTSDNNSSLRTALFHRSTTTAAVATSRNASLLSSVNISYGIPFVASSIYQGLSHRIFRDGNPGSSGTTSGNFGYTTLGIGKNNGSETPIHSGYIYEVLLYNYALTSNERQVVEGYLAYKWGHRSNLPETHPYRTIEPFNRPFIPPDLPNCLVWLDGADVSSMDLSAAGLPTIINNWRDRSGFSNTFLRANIGGIQFEGPSYLSNAQAFFSNGNNNNRLAGNDGLCNQTTVVGVGPNFGLYHIGCNTRALTADFNDAIQIRRLDGTTTTVEYHVDVTGSQGAFTSSTAATATTGGRTSSSNATVIYGCFFGSNYTDVRRNGHPFRGARGATSVNTVAHDINYFTIAAHTDNRQYTGSINEMILYNSIDSSYAYLPRIEQYLARKFNTTWNDLSVNNPYRFFPALSVAFNPLATAISSLTVSNSSCLFWFDSADESTLIRSGNAVSLWLDKSGNNRHAFQSTAANQPSYSSGTGVYFAGLTNNHFMDISGAGALTLRNFSIFAVEERLTGGTTARMFLGGSSTTASANLALGHGSDIGFSFRMATNYNITLPTYATDSRVRVWSFTHDASVRRTITLNGSAFPAAGGSTNLSTYPGAAFGRYTSTVGTTTYYEGRIYEMLIYDGVVSSNLRYQIEGYLAHKWNRDLSFNNFHPYKFTVP